MRLADSKTGARVVPLPPAAARVLAGLSRVPGNPWVFPGRKKGDRQHNINDSWDRVRERAGLDGVRLHDLRHSFASRALALGESLTMIGELLGHGRCRPRRATLIWHGTRCGHRQPRWRRALEPTFCRSSAVKGNGQWRG